MENNGRIAGRLLNIREEQNRKKPEKKDVVFDFIDINGQQYPDIKVYGSTGDEIRSRGINHNVVLKYSLSLRSSIQTPTGESRFSIFAREIRFLHPNEAQTIDIINNYELTGTLAENPSFNQENGQPVADIKLYVMRRNLSKEPDYNAGSPYDLVSIRLRQPHHIEMISGCGKNSTIVVIGKISPAQKPYPNSNFSLVNTEVIGLQVTIQKPLTNANQGGINQGFNQNSMNQGSMHRGFNQNNNQTIHNSGVLRFNPQTGMIVGDLDHIPYDFNTKLAPKGARGVNQATLCVIDQYNRLINSEGQLINENSQLIDQNGQILQQDVQNGNVMQHNAYNSCVIQQNAQGAQNDFVNGGMLQQNEQNGYNYNKNTQHSYNNNDFLAGGYQQSQELTRETSGDYNKGANNTMSNHQPAGYNPNGNGTTFTNTTGGYNPNGNGTTFTHTAGGHNPNGNGTTFTNTAAGYNPNGNGTTFTNTTGGHNPNGSGTTFMHTTAGHNPNANVDFNPHQAGQYSSQG